VSPDRSCRCDACRATAADPLATARILDANRWARRYERWRVKFAAKGLADWADWAAEHRDGQLDEAATLVMLHGQGRAP
jgi:hypothetical protein